ncbi:PRD domain-containing protein [Mediterraneibacter sp. NSJ-55]|uniref:PRD domain-containing protein n=1 Tax=Mediterraneibacter hominis TaxID=2763054 RepID=A0A923LIF4_9FIRM|nr:PRD domain-containing protein [Mediterraneibacter hominis]MBC5688898.1 PRD domain-containing protein [Mediterraneibacter hominis]
MQQVYMNARCREILQMLLESDTYLTQQQIAEKMQVSKRSIYYDLCRINEWLEFYHIPELEMVRGKGILIEKALRSKIEACAEGIEKDENYILSPMERVHLIICIIIYSKEPVYIDQLMDYCMVSRNTIFNDMRVVVNQLQDYDLKLEYESKRGYRISGDSIKIRAIFLVNFQELQSLFENRSLDFIERERIHDNIEKLRKIEEELNTKYVEGSLDSLAVLLPLMDGRDTNLYFPNLKRAELESTKEFQLVEKYFPKLSEKEKIYLCLHLLGARVTVASNDIFEEESNQTVYEITKALIAEFEKIACVTFENKEELGRALFVHINSSLYRYQYGIQIMDTMSKDIIREYPDLFDITKVVSKYIERQIGMPIQDGEIAYLALHFGAHLPISRDSHSSFRILIVCANGISTGNMLRRELQKMLPEAQIVDVIAAQNIQNAQNICDLIVSTVRIKNVVPVVHVHPILTNADREEILRHVKEKPLLRDVENLFSIVKPYIGEKDYETVKKKIDDYFFRGKREGAGDTKRKAKGFLDYLVPGHIQIYNGEYRWTDALRESGKCLLENKSIEKRYIDDIISQLRYYGPYMFITSRVVLAHSKPEEGVNRLDVSLHIFKKNIAFSDFHRANIIIMLAAEDQESHLKILRDILAVFSIQTKIDDILQLETPEEVLAYLGKSLEHEEDL